MLEQTVPMLDAHYVSIALYIDDVLHMISQGKTMLNGLVDLAFLKEVSLD